MTILIEGNTLHVDGVAIDLPHLPVKASVKVWRVPTEYRESGLFVAVTPSGQAEEVPACDMSLCVYLGELDLDASMDAVLAALKAQRLAYINRACDEAMHALASDYPETEVQSWDQQLREAEALQANPQLAPPLLSAMAAARGITVADLAAKVLAKGAAFAAASGAIIGRRQALEDRLAAAATEDDIAAITW